ncbi:MAG: PhoH family protein [Selenomonadaceae bacterium]|nr:PhoH family protein [Selenomonadaceae bacterium]MBQ3971019.1 PhoH family protein [Selenomonadaceae bacterium]
MQQALEREVVFADHKEAYALLGERDEFLQVLTENFDCQIVSRGDRVEFMGEAVDVQRAAKVLEELQFLYRQGTNITMHEVRYGIGLVKGGKGEALHSLFSDTVLVTSRGRHVRPKTLGQRIYLEAIRRNYVTFGIGPAGTGKTYLAVVMAVAALRNKDVDKIILTRPAVEAGERLGFLPGDLQEKVDPYLRPLYDALQDILGLDMYQKFMSRGIIEIAPLAYMRGRTLEDAFVILDEAQNTTEKQMKMFLTRLGFGSRMVITGDLSQVDLPRGVPSGLRRASEILEGVEGIGIVQLQAMDVIRHEVVTRIVEAYERHERKEEERKQ